MDERAAIIRYYAAKVAAARLCAKPGDLAAIIAAIRAEERAALKALKDRAVIDTWERRKRIQRALERRMAALQPARPVSVPKQRIGGHHRG